jgi:hypothetical protein
MVCVDYRKKTLQFYDEEGKKGGYVDLDDLTLRIPQLEFKRKEGIRYLGFGPNSLQVNVDRDDFEVFVNPFFVKFLAQW